MELCDQVIEQIKKDIDVGDLTAVYEMLQHLNTDVLIAYLPEQGLDK